MNEATTTQQFSDPCRLTVVMPCLNEAETVGGCVDKAHRGLSRAGISGEVLVADNGSRDSSIEIARQHGARVVQVVAKGYGNALRGGIEAARSEWIIIGDADNSYDFSDIDRFVERLRAGDDLVMGCRLPSGGGTILPGAMPWKNRWFGNPSLSLIGRMFFKTPVRDFHCGLRAFTRAAYNRMELKTTGMEFASEMVMKAALQGMRVSEVPITLHPDGRSRRPHLRPWRDGWRHLRFMLIYSPRWLFLVPGLIIASAGGLGLPCCRGARANYSVLHSMSEACSFPQWQLLPGCNLSCSPVSQKSSPLRRACFQMIQNSPFFSVILLSSEGSSPV